MFDSPADAVLSAQSEGLAPGPAYMIGNLLIAGHEEAKIARYARVVANATGEQVLSYDRGMGPPEVIYTPATPSA